jgi:ATP-dependent DNA helicase UvrD/PcrA
VSSSAAYLTELNREQRAAVEHGVEEGGSKPLLVIAGAGSGKTKTLAHRVAHLIANGADPRNSPPDILSTIGGRAHCSEISSRKSGWPAEFERARVWYEPHLDRIYDDGGARRADLIQLGQIAAGYTSRERFLTELTLDPPDATSDQAGVATRDEDYLILSTIHSAKGQEWKSVFVLNVVDGCIPSDLGTGTTAELEEERRLLYVAMTRAKDDLHLIVPQRFFAYQQAANGDRHAYASRTRFLPDEILPLFETRSWPPACAPAESPQLGLQDNVIDIGARMRAMWR